MIDQTSALISRFSAFHHAHLCTFAPFTKPSITLTPQPIAPTSSLTCCPRARPCQHAKALTSLKLLYKNNPKKRNRGWGLLVHFFFLWHFLFIFFWRNTCNYFLFSSWTNREEPRVKKKKKTELYSLVTVAEIPTERLTGLGTKVIDDWVIYGFLVYLKLTFCWTRSLHQFLVSVTIVTCETYYFPHIFGLLLFRLLSLVPCRL